MRTMASNICHRGYEVRVRCTEEALHWIIVELVVTKGSKRINATEFNLRPHYVSGDAAVESGHKEGRRLIDQALASGNEKTS